MTVVPAITRLPVWPAPLTAWLTRSHEAFFRSALAGQANAILVRPEYAVEDLGSARISVAGREVRLVSAVRVRSIVVANLHASNDFAHPEIPRAEVRRACEFAEGHARAGEAIVLAGDFNVRDPGLAGYSEPAEGIDHILVRGALATPPETWSRARRQQNGAVLSDHAPIELRVVSENAS